MKIKKEDSHKKEEHKVVENKHAKSKICECMHPKELHYGGNKDWCNTNGCSCQEYKVVQ